ncbi:hypothetical protein M409DRAFT_53632 [Zasmidium cellare ATCC 36951]|uniref:UNC-45/Cro1/She4 central domain-containing protein n=1 Tax=Zasmidium cellare ATCC 36951 TaxID=1080233 RepID=A0A6A6CK75_ZASCE|nr:uncharacterized protein M409DRAFT_53632 [Zasmidium cellare ATCC 36951]KAF2167637.1 hypothetical protein M409DRAFT_53632 [Zasmidium cellare ATCC 36951]
MANENDDSIEKAFQALSLNTKTTEAVTLLSDASKTHVEIRERLADPQTLKSLIEIIECNLSESLPTVDRALRCLGNACADNNSGRDAITSLGFSWAIQCLRSDDEETGILTTKVLYNICSDHEGSQQQCYREKVHLELVRFLNLDAVVESEEYTFAVDLLLWITGHKAALEPTLDEPLPDHQVAALLRLPRLYADQSDLDNFGSLVESVLAFLRDTTVQQQIVELQVFMGIWTILELVEDRGTSLDPEVEQDAEDLKVLAPLSTSLIWCMSDFAARADFAQAHANEVLRSVPNDHQDGDHTAMEVTGLVDRLIECIRDHADDEFDAKRGIDGSLYTAACETLGNLLWGSTPEYSYLVGEEELHAPLFRRIIRSGNGPSVAAILHSICGLLIQLSRPSRKVREEIGAHEEALAALEILCRHEMSQIKQDSVKLLKALGKDCPRNQERFTDLAQEVLQAIRASNDTTMAGAEPS